MTNHLKNLIEKLNQINETPFLNDTDLFHFETAMISKNALERAYDYFGAVFQEILIYQKKDGSAIVVGMLDDNGNLIHFLDIQTDDKAYPVEPTQLSPNCKQIGLVLISKNAAQQGITRAVYQLLASKYDLVSDKVQYRGGKRLWMSLASHNISNIYVFDGNVHDYVRDSSGNIIKYNASNIEEAFIWGTSIEHQNRILVASMKEKT